LSDEDFALATKRFAKQSEPMEPKWAEENLQTIRTLMERSAVYRRALAPIMMYVGSVGIVGGLVGWWLRIDSARGFVLFWSCIATVALIGAFILVRRQALKDSEPFWSPPTRRVVQALLPSFVLGGFVAGLTAWYPLEGAGLAFTVIFWCWLFGCGIHAAGFFMQRGIRILGWAFIGIGCVVAAILDCDDRFQFFMRHPHLFMAASFGGLHLACGIYLYFTENKNPVA
jgi:hypothetical protein